jgi:plasmid stability protein
MAQLVVRNVDEKLVRALKLRAARNGRSAEAEHRELLRAALLDRDRPGLKKFLQSMPASVGNVRRPADRARRVRL